ncbi:MAG TPA: methionine--tRNA ligase, partial [Anseongella sp.]|nr:methionine--tRNA ligase [Anseongella sp.]
FLPFTAGKLRKMFNLSQKTWDNAGNGDLLPEGHELNEPELLFEKIEDSTVEAQVRKLENSRRRNELERQAVAPSKEAIAYEDFARMDIRTGTILEAEKVAKTKKLLKLRIDTGIDQRTVVSGIAEFFEPAELIGKQVSILVNLAPREIRGIRSQGMILMAEDRDGSPRFIAPGEPTANGSIIS